MLFCDHLLRRFYCQSLAMKVAQFQTSANYNNAHLDDGCL